MPYYYYYHVLLANGFCNYSQTVSLQYGTHTWNESVGAMVLALPCANRPGHNVTRLCQINGSGWGNPNYTQCETSKV